MEPIRNVANRTSAKHNGSVVTTSSPSRFRYDQPPRRSEYTLITPKTAKIPPNEVRPGCQNAMTAMGWSR